MTCTCGHKKALHEKSGRCLLCKCEQYREPVVCDPAGFYDDE